MTESSLFPDLEPRRTAPARADGPFASVAIERSLDRVLDYSIPKAFVSSLRPGQRVRVPLGKNNRPTHGYIVSIQPTTSYPRIKPILSVDDGRVLVPPTLLELSRWIARYYCCPFGTVLDSIIPAAVKKKIGMGYMQMVRAVRGREDLQALLGKTRAPKRRAIIARLLQLEPEQSIELLRLAGEACATPATVRKLAKAGIISITAEPDMDFANEAPSTAPLESSISLNEDQQRVLDELSPRLAGGFSVNLLHGVTGSGKTEIYLRCISQIIQMKKRAIVLVPEIALTPQTVSRFTARFPRVAILHSGLSGSQRHKYWHQIAQGQADVVVGARSAIFAPLPDLGMIVVDEEHETSYKHDSAPRYHARDVSIKRAQLENIPILLGSATPSLESWHRARSAAEAAPTPRNSAAEAAPTPRNSAAEAAPTPTSPPRYHLLRLPSRVRGLALPKIELIDMKVERRMRGNALSVISRRLEHLLNQTLAQRHQAILLLNRRGYSSFVYCNHCEKPLSCKACNATITYHRFSGAHAHTATAEEGSRTGNLFCHYCGYTTPLPAECPDCGKKLSLLGMGTQRVEEELTRKFPDMRYARVDSDTMRSGRDYEALLARFASGEIQVMLGTQMIAKGLDYPNVTLVGVISGDTALALPDFRAAERTIQLLTQVAGRAGRGDQPGQVVLQTFMPEDPAIQSAIAQDYESFAARELKARQEIGLPPFARMVRIIMRDQELDRLHSTSQKVAAAISAAIAAIGSSPAAPAVTMKGPNPCAINRIAGYHRVEIRLFCLSAARLQNVLAVARRSKAFTDGDRIAVDVDPLSLL